MDKLDGEQKPTHKYHRRSTRFYDEVIDRKDALETIRFYIRNNPTKLDSREG